MSYHAIENLVEDAVHVIEQTDLLSNEQRKIIYNLYRFQNKFDSSYTVLRCFPFLERIGFIKKLPAHEHPDFGVAPDYFKNLEGTAWVYTDIDQGREGHMVYYNEGYIYPEYGSRLWQRMVKQGKWDEASEEVQNIALVTLIADMITIANKQRSTYLMQDLYLSLINAFLELELDTDDGLPENFEEWIDDRELLRLRELAIEHNLLKIKKKDTDFDTPSLSSELRLATSPDRQAKVMFLMDTKKSVDKILHIYRKAVKIAEETPLKVAAIADMSRKEMKSHGWIYVSANGPQVGSTHKWLWYKEVTSGGHNHIIFTEIILEVELSSVLVKQYVQHGLLRKWQQKSLTHDLDDTHFEISAFELIGDNVLENYLNFFGLWVLPFKSKQVAILKSFAELLAHVTRLDVSYLDKIYAEFPSPFFSKPYASYIDIFESDATIPDFLLISNLYSISLLFIYKAVQDGKLEDALHIDDLIESRFTDRFREQISWYKEQYIPYIDAVKKGKNPALPDLYKRK